MLECRKEIVSSIATCMLDIQHEEARSYNTAVWCSEVSLRDATMNMKVIEISSGAGESEVYEGSIRLVLSKGGEGYLPPLLGQPD